MATRRFVLHQKRKYKEIVARLTAEKRLARSETEVVRHLLRQAQSHLKDVIAIVESVAYNSVAIPPKQQSVGRERLPAHYMIPILPKVEVHAFNSTASVVPVKYVNLSALRTFVKERAEQFALAIHLILDNTKESAYMISKTALAQMTEEQIAKHLVPQVTAQLVHHIRNDRR